jgi:hypothetical protein
MPKIRESLFRENRKLKRQIKALLKHDKAKKNELDRRCREMKRPLSSDKTLCIYCFNCIERDTLPRHICDPKARALLKPLSENIDRSTRKREVESREVLGQFLQGWINNKDAPSE